MFDRCRLIVEPDAADGRWNMAVDEALLESVIADHEPVLRWYEWREPTLSLGYFQPSAEVLGADRWNPVAKVRRLTGGGAILHDREWTYSCVVPVDCALLTHPYDLYDVIHNAVIAWFATAAGIELSQRGSSQREGSEPTLCFFRHDSHDVCWRDQKVLGSAQRRRKGVLLQHGSLILRRSQFTPEIAGLCDLTGSDAFCAQRAALATHVAQCLATEVVPTTLTPIEESHACELQATRYADILQR